MTLTLDTLVKVTAADRGSMHGGSGKWTKGRWRSVKLPLEPCRNGLHVVTIRQSFYWLGPRIGVVEVTGERIDQDDKTIVERARVIEWLDTWNDRSARLFAADCAERVLSSFERARPGDERPRKAIETTRAFARGEATRKDLDAAGAAARAAAGAAARDAAGAAAGAAAWAAARAAAWAAAWDAERELQAHRLLEYLRGEA